ncbi:tenascin isoform X2 [Nilaparvata lugens]|uniref:tenascin isoform X2 n=1 Tax=Nilaparvata lugens TaxID=108931 RepID=UPI00193E1CFE|nr:tenascin isoform X2 [Nilaparvata lugens]
MVFSCKFSLMAPHMVCCLLATIFLTTAPVSSLEIAMTAVAAPGEITTVDQSNSTSRMFSLSDNIKRITRSAKELYGLAYNAISSTGVSNKVLGLKCEKASDCSSVEFSLCADGMCSCDANHTISNVQTDKCLKGVNLGEDCQEDVQCQKYEVGSVCMAFKCVCSVNYSEKEGKCVPNPKIGSSCVGNVDCHHIPFVECIDNVCACPDAMLPGKHANVCLTVASPDGRAPCEEDIQCSAQYGDKSRCILGFCECDHSYHAANGKCIPDLKLGAECSRRSDCVVSRHTEEGNIRDCFNNTCTCATGYKSANEEDHCVEAGNGYQLHASLAWLTCVFVVPYLF